MSTPFAVSAHGLSKMYLLYQKPQDRLKQSLFRRFGRNYARVFWALHDVSFDLARGKALGIIGRNGSGKSTLLQIICGTLQPTGGEVKVNGRVTALLELGAGFNPEFTGRENIFLNGATLEISAAEMRKRQDEIIDFAQIGDFIDQPVKIYSSGMYVRLAFAIATSVDPDVLVIDEALAVGDVGFVIKCMNRIKKMREEGATILLVTHDVQTARSICDEVMWLDEGRTLGFGSPLDITAQYLHFLFGDEPKAKEPTDGAMGRKIPLFGESDSHGPLLPLVDLSARSDLIRWGSGSLTITGVALFNDGDKPTSIFEYGQTIRIEFEVRAVKDTPSTEVGFGAAFRNLKGLDIITTTTYDQGWRLPPLQQGQALRISFDLQMILAPGDYALVLNAEDRSQGMPLYYDFVENAAIIRVVSDRLIWSLALPPVNQKIWLCE